MDPHPQFGGASFRLAAKGLVALHRLMKDGKGDSPEAESIRDALDAPLNALSRTEEERAKWLSEDLYSISEPSVAATRKEMNSEAQQRLIEALEARQSREWDRSLALLRQWRDYISPALLSYLRGSIWLESGNPEVATMFLEHASASDPANGNYKAFYMYALAESSPDAAVALAKEVLANHANYAPVVVARAAEICFNDTRTTSEIESARLYRELIPILEQNVARIEEGDRVASRTSARAMTLGLLGFCNEILGNMIVAVNNYSLGLQTDPDNDGLLVARGILQYGTSSRAITDFEQAVALGFPGVWPYLFLAHHYLITNRFGECRITAEIGLTKSGTDSAKSQLEEWRAIAQAELGFSAELVRAAFEASIRLDPSNDLAKRNRDIFEGSLSSPYTLHRWKWEQTPASVVRQFGLAERRYGLAA